MFVIIKKEKHMEKPDSSLLFRQPMYADKKTMETISFYFSVSSRRWFYGGRNYLFLRL